MSETASTPRFSASDAGVLACIAATFSLAFCWVPVVGMSAGALGLVIAMVGVVFALTTEGEARRVIAPASGAALSVAAGLVALAISLHWSVAEPVEQPPLDVATVTAPNGASPRVVAPSIPPEPMTASQKLAIGGALFIGALILFRVASAMFAPVPRELEADAAPVATLATRRPGELSCRQCGAEMRKRVKSSGNATGIAVALIVFAVGVILVFVVPLLGCFIGPAVCLCALFMGGKRTKVWQCVACGYMFERGG